MSKAQTAIESPYAFSLTPTNPSSHYSHITADFHPPLRQQFPNISLNKASNSIVPAFLLDHNFFTPTFILPRDKEYYVRNETFEREKFLARISKANKIWNDELEAEENVCDISLPVPTTNYCQICKNGYTSYEEHLKDASHQRQARFSKANSYIGQLQKRYLKLKPKLGTKAKTKHIQKLCSQKSNNIIKNSCKKKGQNSNASSLVESRQVAKINQSTNLASFVKVSNS